MKKIVKLFFTSLTILAAILLYWLFVDDDSIVAFEEEIKSSEASYEVKLSYRLNGATASNVADIYVTHKEYSGPLRLVTLFSPSNVSIGLFRDNLLVCFSASDIELNRFKFNIGNYGLQEVRVIALPFEEGVRCGGQFDKQIDFSTYKHGLD